MTNLAGENATDAPDWEGFGRAVMDFWPEGDLDGGELQDLAEKYGLIRAVKGGFNPEIHEDEYSFAEPGDPWFVPAYPS